MSCRDTSKAQLARTTPVRPPTVNKKMKPKTQIIGGDIEMGVPCNVANQEKILIPVGIAIIIVAAVKYARVSISMPTVNMW